MPPVWHQRQALADEKNRRWMEGSGGLLPSYAEPEQIHDMSLTFSHTSQGLRMWIHGSAHHYQRFTVDGKLNLRRLEELQPEYHKAAVEGITWDRIHWAVEDRWPWVPKLMQETGNAGQAIARCVSRRYEIDELAKRRFRVGELDRPVLVGEDLCRLVAVLANHAVDHCSSYGLPAHPDLGSLR